LFCFVLELIGGAAFPHFVSSSLSSSLPSSTSQSDFTFISPKNERVNGVHMSHSTPQFSPNETLEQVGEINWLTSLSDAITNVNESIEIQTTLVDRFLFIYLFIYLLLFLYYYVNTKN